MKRHYILESTCVICGDYVPEGSMVCPHCLERADSYPKGKPDIRKNFRLIQSRENNQKKA